MFIVVIEVKKMSKVWSKTNLQTTSTHQGKHNNRDAGCTVQGGVGWPQSIGVGPAKINCGGKPIKGSPPKSFARQKKTKVSDRELHHSTAGTAEAPVPSVCLSESPAYQLVILILPFHFHS